MFYWIYGRVLALISGSKLYRIQLLGLVGSSVWQTLKSLDMKWRGGEEGVEGRVAS